jgi:heterotetrameric sarcosine oxidase gamma subunit
MAERASPFAAPIAGDRSGIRLSVLPRGSLWQVACWPESFAEVRNAVAEALDCEPPAPGRVSRGKDGRLLVRIEPLKWWVLGEDGAECPLKPDPVRGAWLDMSHDQGGLAVEGENAAELLKRLVPIDLRECSFPDLSYAATMAHHMITRVLREAEDSGPRYRVMVMRSFADDLRQILEHHLAHFG